jgi:DNA-binding MarR family transcriptional regulator
VETLAQRLRALVLRRPAAWPDVDVTLPQLRTLTVVRRRQPLGVTELAGILGMRLAATSALVNRVVRAGLLHRSPDPHDRRRVQLSLTADGMHLLTTLDERSAGQYHSLLQRMSPQGRRALAFALEELIGLLADPASHPASHPTAPLGQRPAPDDAGSGDSR